MQQIEDQSKCIRQKVREDIVDKRLDKVNVVDGKLEQIQQMKSQNRYNI